MPVLRRIGHIVIVCLLVISTSGITINRHFCGTSLVKTTIGNHPPDCCGKPCKCCHDESISLKITDHFQLSRVNFDPKDYSAGHLLIASLPSSIASFQFDVLFSNRDIFRIKPFRINPTFSGNAEALLQVFLV